MQRYIGCLQFAVAREQYVAGLVHFEIHSIVFERAEFVAEDALHLDLSNWSGKQSRRFHRTVDTASQRTSGEVEIDVSEMLTFCCVSVRSMASLCSCT